MKVTVAFEGREIAFDPFALNLEKPDGTVELAKALSKGDASDLAALVEGITRGLSNEDRKAFTVAVCWSAAMQPGQEIFPSQEYVRAEKKEDEKLSRIYAKLPTRVGDRIIEQASMHSQKISAALRHIDIWHDCETHPGAIAVNPYGGIQETSDVLRAPKSKKSFYDLRAKAQPLLDAVETANGPEDLSGDVHFVMANLVRGGVFGSSSKAAEANG